MAEQNRFGQRPEGLRCEEWEALLADALDGLLPPGDAAAFKAHSTGCAGCADLLAHAEQGREWLEYLHAEPEIPEGLLGRILDRTAGAGSMPLPLVAGVPGTAGTAIAMPLRRSFHETRLLMTVAMAFFSIALTLNLAGIRLSSLRLADLRPSAISSTLSREFYGARGQVVRYYDNMRFVYQLESRMRELRRDVEIQPTQQTAPQDGNGQSQKRKDGQSKSSSDTGAVLEAGGQSRHNHTSRLLAQLSAGDREQTQSGAGAAAASALVNADDLTPLGPHRAGQQRIAENKGRSLA